MAELNSDDSEQQIPIIMSTEPTWFRNSYLYAHFLNTFKGVWELPFITASEMAQAGFTYSGVSNCVKCMYCSKEFTNWKLGDDPYFSHRRRSPHCLFFDIYKSYNFYSVDHYFSPEVHFFQNQERMKDILDTFGIFQKIHAPMYKAYLTFDARFQSFEKCSIELKLKKDAICKDGLFYAGNGKNDHLRCFYCGHNLLGWAKKDLDPLEEHAKFSKKCSYVLLMKGKIFVEKLLNIDEHFNTTNQKLCKLISEREYCSILTNRLIANSLKRVIDEELKSSIVELLKIPSKGNLNLSQRQDLETLPDSITCVVCCVTVIEVAFIPCRHVACIHCSLELLSFGRPCPICRNPFNIVMRIFLAIEDNNQLQLPCSSSKIDDEILDPTFCKICRKEKMEAAFIPCKHVYACVKCAAKIQVCPVCTEYFFSNIQIFL